jgi:ABC-type branched-subunit amino acid transport system permease subunit
VFVQNVMLKQLNILFDNIQVPFLSGIFIDYQYLLYGIALVAMMLLRPEGCSRVPSTARAAHRGGCRLRRDGRPDGGAPE